jgi:hypothetical protein
LEEFLTSKMIQAIGRAVTTKDFESHFHYYCKKHFFPQYAPKAFSYLVRKQGSDPDGSVAMEDCDGNPIRMFSDVRRMKRSMSFKIDSSVNVTMRGEKSIHFWFRSQFSDEKSPNYLRIRGRECGAFLVVAGKMISDDEIDPEIAFLICGKWTLEIPVSLSLSLSLSL